MCFREEDHLGKVPFYHHILSRVHMSTWLITVDANFNHFADSICQVFRVSLFSLFPYYILWKDATLCNTHLEWRIMPHLLESKIYKLPGILHGKFVCSLPFFNLSHHIYQDGHWVISQYYFTYLFYCWKRSIFTNWDLFQLTSVSLWRIPIVEFICLCTVFEDFFTL